MNPTLTPTEHSDLVGGSTASRRIGCPRSYALEQFRTPRGEHERVAPEILRRLLTYDPETGRLYWRARTRDLCGDETAWKRWNRNYAGTEAFTARTTAGYLKGKVLDKTCLAHRVAWAIVHGAYPAEHIDHINHDKTDNRLVNLRAVSGAENHKNRKLPQDNKSGMVGVLRDVTRARWRAYFCADSKRTTLGYYHCFARAASARKTAEAQHGYHQNHGRRSAT